MSDETFRPDWRILGALVRLAPSSSKHGMDAVRVTVTEKDATYDVTDGHAAIRVCVDGGGAPSITVYPATEIVMYAACNGRMLMYERSGAPFPDIDAVMPTEPGKALCGTFKARLVGKVASVVADVCDAIDDGHGDGVVSIESGATVRDAYVLRSSGKGFRLTALVMPVGGI